MSQRRFLLTVGTKLPIAMVGRQAILTRHSLSASDKRWRVFLCCVTYLAASRDLDCCRCCASCASSSFARSLKSFACSISSTRAGLFNERPSANRKHNSAFFRKSFGFITTPHLREEKRNGAGQDRCDVAHRKCQKRTIALQPGCHHTLPGQRRSCGWQLNV